MRWHLSIYQWNPYSVSGIIRKVLKGRPPAGFHSPAVDSSDKPQEKKEGDSKQEESKVISIKNLHVLLMLDLEEV